MTTVLRASDVSDLLSLIPVLAGFSPSNSLVLLPFQGRRTHGALRLDLPDPSMNRADYARGALEILCRVPGVAAVAMVIYTEEPAGDPAAMAHSELIGALRDACADAAVSIMHAVCVSPDGWIEFGDEPTRVRPLTEIPASPDVPGLADVSGDQLAGARLPRSTSDERDRVAQALAAMESLRGQSSLSGQELLGNGRGPFAGHDDIADFLEALIDAPENPPPADVAALLWLLNRSPLREIVLVHWAMGRTEGRRALTEFLRSGADSAALSTPAAALLLGLGPRPDADRLRLALTVVRTTASRSPESARCDVLSVAAWISWALGRSSHAAAYLDLAQQTDPGHRLSTVLKQLLEASVLPEWVFDTTTTSPRERRASGARRTSRPAANDRGQA